MTGRNATALTATGHWLVRKAEGRGAAWGVATLCACVMVAGLAGAWWLAVVLAIAAAAVPALWSWPVFRRHAAAPDGAAAAIARALAAEGDAVCLWLRLSDPATGGPPDHPVMVARTARLAKILRAGDQIERRGSADIVVVLAPGSAPDLEDAVQLAARVQGAVTASLAEADCGGMQLAATVGLCRGADIAPADPGRGAAASDAEPGQRPATPAAIMDAAVAALADALAEGVGTIRVFAPGIRDRQSRRTALATDAARALAAGDFTAWFQPQICTDTGRISGFEALARWTHPDHGLVPPADFLPALAAAGLLERLGNVMLDQSLDALTAWDRAGFDIPSVGVNMSEADLRDPHLAQRIAWMLDRHDLHADRLAIEVLESVVAAGGSGAGDSPVLRNVRALANMGCRIDLDDFGTGHASITTLHRLPVRRIKIDRSFVTGVDQDRAQQKMMMTILSMCDHLGLESLAEGVESQPEHAMLAQLGCNHVQGFGIGRPMPFEASCDWLRTRDAELDAAMRPIRRHP